MMIPKPEHLFLWVPWNFKWGFVSHLCIGSEWGFMSTTDLAIEYHRWLDVRPHTWAQWDFVSPWILKGGDRSYTNGNGLHCSLVTISFYVLECLGVERLSTRKTNPTKSLVIQPKKKKNPNLLELAEAGKGWQRSSVHTHEFFILPNIVPLWPQSQSIAVSKSTEVFLNLERTFPIINIPPRHWFCFSYNIFPWEHDISVGE